MRGNLFRMAQRKPNPLKQSAAHGGLTMELEGNKVLITGGASEQACSRSPF